MSAVYLVHLRQRRKAAFREWFLGVPFLSSQFLATRDRENGKEVKGITYTHTPLCILENDCLAAIWTSFEQL